jgi:formylglycine-generating enzyme required for sulfatase activity
MGNAPDWWPKGPANNRPVNRVSWFDAVTFCNMVSESAGLKPCYRIQGETVEWVGSEGYRLPTEAEWEYACRAGSQTRWCFGDDEGNLGEYAWYNANADAPQPVERKRANVWGLYDMHGNVWEWCWDWEAEYPELPPRYSLADPRGPGQGTLRVLRGGSFEYEAGHVRCADRLANWPADRGRNWGFRCVRSAGVPDSNSATSIMARSDRADARELAKNGMTAAEAMGESFVERTTGIRFLWVPGGTFTMGADDLGDACGPPHSVQVSPFWLAETPVTNRQYELFLRATGNEEPRYWRDRNFNGFEQPVVGVSWPKAKQFCRWLSKVSNWLMDLPTEAQWEFAGRGEENRNYPWGNEEPDEQRAHFGKSWGEDVPLPVGSLPAGRGPFGHLDLVGNAWEWCKDAWDEEEYKKRGRLTIDPTGPAADDEAPDVARVCRGGAFDVGPVTLRAAYRRRRRADAWGGIIGFRVAVAYRNQ